MQDHRRIANVLIASDMQLPDFFTDETVLRAKNDYPCAHTILINTRTGNIRFTDTDRELSSLEVQKPFARSDLFAALARKLDEDTLIVADHIFMFADNSDEASLCYWQLLSNPKIEVRFFRTGWLDSSVFNMIRNYRESEIVSFKCLDMMIRQTFATETLSPMINSKDMYSNMKEAPGRYKKKRPKSTSPQ